MKKNLGGRWTFRQADSEDPTAVTSEPRGWLQAAVPGCVHLDLLAAGKIPDPFYGRDELEVQWVERENWLYRRRFNCPEGLLDRQRVDLVCEGLDTFATVLLNGMELGRADNMFRAWRWDVSHCLQPKANELLIFFQSPSGVCERLEEEHGALPAALHSPRVYGRKEQCAWGWDWGPRLASSGVWRPICLHGYDGARIVDVLARVDYGDPEVPILEISVELEALRGSDVELRAELSGPGSRQAVTMKSRLRRGPNTVSGSIAVRDPRLWWPAGMGPQNLYKLKVSGACGEDALEEKVATIGLRRVELERSPDEAGESFTFHVNGEPVFCRGANWIPADSFLPRLTREDYGDLISKAAEANINMLRVWGGGIYEADEFYKACDRAGIMVWQDFMFACACYPDHLGWFCESVRAEAESNVRRLRNHPSLVLWCGNNENQWGFHESWSGLGRLPGEKIYEEILPGVCSQLDGTRPYWPGSPYGGDDPNDPGRGDQHNWEVWHGWKDPSAYQGYAGRFISEFGLQAPPSLGTIKEYIPSSERHMQSRTMVHHNRAGEGTERLYRYLSACFQVPTDFESTVYLMQLVQAEAMKTGVEHWRSSKFHTSGALIWQFNDCWPVSSWSFIDSRRRPKALYFYAKRFFAPVLPVIECRDGRVSMKVINDLRERHDARLIYGLSGLDGQAVWVQSRDLVVPANSVMEAAAMDEPELKLSDPTAEFLWCRLIQGRQGVAVNTHFFSPFKHVPFARPDWTVKVNQPEPNTFSITLSADVFAKGVALRAEGDEARFDDNFFDLLPEDPVTVVARTSREMDTDAFRRRLMITTVADALQRT